MQRLAERVVASRRCAQGSNGPPHALDVPLVQVALVTPEKALVSVTPVDQRHHLRKVVAPFPMGLAPVNADPQYPPVVPGPPQAARSDVVFGAHVQEIRQRGGFWRVSGRLVL